MRIEGRLAKKNKTLRMAQVTDVSDETRTHKIFAALAEICHEFDLGQPIWLQTNIEEFQQRARTRFMADAFIEEINFDFLELSVIEED